MLTVTPPLIILERWQQAIRLDNLRDWCVLCDLKDSKLEPMTPSNAIAYHGDIDGDFDY